MKIERLLAITVLLLNRRRLTAKELAARFEVTTRTIYRDIDTLNGAGIPVVSCQGYEGGFEVPENYKLSRQLLTFEDMVSILTTLNGVNRTMKNPDLSSVIEKITALIPEEKEPSFQDRADVLVVDISSWGGEEKGRQYLAEIHRAILSSSRLKFDYTTAEGQRSTRKVEPLTLIYKNFVWYLIAYCCVRQEGRLFRLTRIKKIETLAERFARKRIDPKQFLEDTPARPMVKLCLRFNPAVRFKVEEYFDEQVIAVEKSGSLLVEISFPESDWIVSFLLSFGDMVEVISPPIYRERLRSIAVKMMANYHTTI